MCPKDADGNVNSIYPDQIGISYSLQNANEKQLQTRETMDYAKNQFLT